VGLFLRNLDPIDDKDGLRCCCTLNVLNKGGMAVKCIRGIALALMHNIILPFLENKL